MSLEGGPQQRWDTQGQKATSGQLLLGKMAGLSDEEHDKAVGTVKRLQPGQKINPVKPISEAEAEVWKEFSSSFRRRNNQLG